MQFGVFEDLLGLQNLILLFCSFFLAFQLFLLPVLLFGQQLLFLIFLIQLLVLLDQLSRVWNPVIKSHIYDRERGVIILQIDAGGYLFRLSEREYWLFLFRTFNVLVFGHWDILRSFCSLNFLNRYLSELLYTLLLGLNLLLVDPFLDKRLYLGRLDGLHFTLNVRIHFRQMLNVINSFEHLLVSISVLIQDLMLSLNQVVSFVGCS